MTPQAWSMHKTATCKSHILKILLLTVVTTLHYVSWVCEYCMPWTCCQDSQELMRHNEVLHAWPVIFVWILVWVAVRRSAKIMCPRHWWPLMSSYRKNCSSNSFHLKSRPRKLEKLALLIVRNQLHYSLIPLHTIHVVLVPWGSTDRGEWPWMSLL